MPGGARTAFIGPGSSSLRKGAIMSELYLTVSCVAKENAAKVVAMLIDKEIGVTTSDGPIGGRWVIVAKVDFKRRVDLRWLAAEITRGSLGITRLSGDPTVKRVGAPDGSDQGDMPRALVKALGLGKDGS